MVRWLGWNGPESGRGSVDDVVSHTRPVVDALKKHANEIAQDAAFNLDTLPEHRTGNSQIGVVHMGESHNGFSPDLDSHVYLEDATVPMKKRKGVAVGIEANLHPIGRAVDSAIAKGRNIK